MTSFAEYRDQWSAMQHLLAMPPLQRPGAVILHPVADPTLRFDREQELVKGPPPDNHYLILGGQGPSSLRSYTFGQSNVGIIVSGSYKYPPSGSRDFTIYEIVSAKFGSGANREGADGRKFLARSDFDFSKIADYFEARSRGGEDRRTTTTLTIDSRDEHNRLREVEKAMNKAGVEESRKRLLARIGK